MVDSPSEQTDVSFENYLPAMPRLSGTPGRVERFVTNLLRRRGSYRIVLRPKGR